MGLKSRKGKKAKAQRREPQLFADSGRRGSSSSGKPARKRRSFFGFLFGLAIRGTVMATIIAGLGLGYVWMSLNQKGLLQIPAGEPGIMLLADDGTRLPSAAHSSATRCVSTNCRTMCRTRHRHRGPPLPLPLRRRSHGPRPRHDPELALAGVVQGGSTLTQQLAKNLFLTPERTMPAQGAGDGAGASGSRHKFSKDEILQLYLNRVYFGAGATGIEKAAQTFFGKSAARRHPAPRRRSSPPC